MYYNIYIYNIYIIYYHLCLCVNPLASTIQTFVNSFRGHVSVSLPGEGRDCGKEPAGFGQQGALRTFHLQLVWGEATGC